MTPPQQCVRSAYDQQTAATAMLRARPMFALYCKRLRLPDSIMMHAEDLYQRAYCTDGNFLEHMTSTRHSRLFLACIFLCCRQAGIMQYFSGMVAKYDSLIKDPLVKKTMFREALEAIWHLENFIDNMKLKDDPITVSWRPFTDSAGSEIVGPTLGEVKIMWSGGMVAFLVGQYNTKSPKLRDMGLKRTKKAEDGVEEAKDEAEDWEVIDWTNEQKVGNGNDDELRKDGGSGGWTGALRRGIFG